MRAKLKAPFPYFGGKSRVAALVWDRLGDVDNYIEPFMGSAAVLLARPHAARVETVNDRDCMVANFWRATAADPHAVAVAADGPINEADLHAWHRWLVLSDEAREFRRKMRTDPHYFDAVISGRWCWGLCCWIGGGWCQAPEDRAEGDRIWTNTENVPWSGKGGDALAGPGEQLPKLEGYASGIVPEASGKTVCHEERRPFIAQPGTAGNGQGVHGNQPRQKRPRAHSQHWDGGGGSLPGVHAKLPCEREKMPNSDRRGDAAAVGGPCEWEQTPLLTEPCGGHRTAEQSQQVPRATGGKNGSPSDTGAPAECMPSLSGAAGCGIHAAAGLSEQRPPINKHAGLGIHAESDGGMLGHGATSRVSDFARPQLADAYDIGRGVNSNGALGTCAARLAWLKDWFGRLRDRLRTVRVCCGDWPRVCGSESVTTRLGLTGIFFDPPYSAAAGRAMGLYSCESGTVAHDVRRYCLERGGDPRYRIALAGYAGEGHEELEARGWERVNWKAQGGYGNRSAKGKANSRKEALWFSPHCRREEGLFDLAD